MRDIILEKLCRVKKLISSMNSDVVTLINATALIEIKLRRGDLSKREYTEIEGELNVLIAGILKSVKY